MNFYSYYEIKRTVEESTLSHCHCIVKRITWHFPTHVRTKCGKRYFGCDASDFNSAGPGQMTSLVRPPAPSPHVMCCGPSVAPSSADYCVVWVQEQEFSTYGSEWCKKPHGRDAPSANSLFAPASTHSYPQTKEIFNQIPNFLRWCYLI